MVDEIKKELENIDDLDSLIDLKYALEALIDLKGNERYYDGYSLGYKHGRAKGLSEISKRKLNN